MTKITKLPLEQAWANWVNCLKGNDANSIFNQISMMVWDTAIFRLILEGRQIQIENEPKHPAINGSLHSFIDRNYFASQSACIRRLTDDSASLTGKRGVYSVSALIRDLNNYRSDLTRENYFRLRSMQYDFTEIRKKEQEFFRTQTTGTAFFVPSEFDWERVAEAHQLFDRLSGCTYENRQPSDMVLEKVFVRLQERLTACKAITDYVDKFVAHSATPESRSIQNIEASKITLRHIWDAQQIIFEVAEFISGVLLSESHMALAIESPGFFQHWSTPLFDKSESERLYDAFKRYRKETENWNQNSIDQIWRLIEA
jgi:hypothetical protein